MINPKDFGSSNRVIRNIYPTGISYETYLVYILPTLIGATRNITIEKYLSYFIYILSVLSLQ